MKLFLKIVAAVIVAAILAIAAILFVINRSGIPTYEPGKIDLKVEVTPERVLRGKHTAEMLCIGCHLDNDTGTLAGKWMPDVPAQFGSAHSANITGDPETGIGTWTDGEIAYLLRTGVRRDGRYTPPWMVKLPLMADEDLKDIIAFLRSDDPLVKPVSAKRPLGKPSLLTKVLAHTVFKPIPYPVAPIPTPDPADPVAQGKYLVQARALCYSCHSLDFAKNDELRREGTPIWVRACCGAGVPRILQQSIAMTHAGTSAMWSTRYEADSTTRACRPSAFSPPRAKYGRPTDW
jgi:mono/diheme cytochrome c family protein